MLDHACSTHSRFYKVVNVISCVAEVPGFHEPEAIGYVSLLNCFPICIRGVVEVVDHIVRHTPLIPFLPSGKIS